MEKEGGQTYKEQLSYGYQLTTFQKPTAQTVSTLLELYQTLQKQYATDKNFTKLAPSPEAAARVVIANALLNLDAAITK